jgi:hypothetical protein
MPIIDQDLVDKIRDFFDDREDIQKTNNARSHQEHYFEDWEERIDWNENPEDLGNNITYAIYGPDESEYDPWDDDESTEDFLIDLPEFNHLPGIMKLLLIVIFIVMQLDSRLDECRNVMRVKKMDYLRINIDTD